MKTFAWVIGSLGVALCACSFEGRSPEAEIAPEDEPRIGPPPPGDPNDLGLEDEVCPTTRHILWREDPGPCPSFGDGLWLGQRLFAQGTTWLGTNDIELEGELASVCRYRWTGAADPSQNQIDALYNQAIFDSAGPDCEVVQPQAQTQNDAITDEIDVVLEDIFHAAVGRMDGTALDLGANEAQRHRVDVITVDTQPHAMPSDPRSEHGEVVSRIIESIACPDGATGCHVRVQRVLGLPRWENGVDLVRGGYFASYGDVAAAIKEATERWIALNVGNPEPSPLIINLSIGWHPYAALNVGEAGENAVKLAIEDARCRGAVVITSAGNKDTFCAEVPLLPAGWEALAAPDEPRCDDVGSPTLLANVEPYAPLVHSIGGLDLHGDELENGREGGRPRLAAAGSHTLVGAPGTPTPALTGTSVSAAAVTGIAALVWSFNPGLSADEVMQSIYDGGQPLDESADADYGLIGEPLGAIQRVDACGALENACGVQGCPGSIQFANCVSTWPDAEDVVTTIAELQADEVVNTGFGVDPKACPRLCGGNLMLHTPSGVAAQCDEAEHDSRDRLISPQPDTHLCQACSLTVEAAASTRAALNREFDGAAIDDLVIEISYSDGSLHTFDFDQSVQLDADDVTEIALPELEKEIEIERATITISLSNGYRQSDSLIIERDPAFSG